MATDATTPVLGHRLLAPAYCELADRVQAQLEGTWAHAQPRRVRSYFDQPDFGSLRFVLHAAGVPHAVPAALRMLFGATRITCTGSVWRCDVEEFPLELVVMSGEDYATACDYLAWNDAGTLIHPIAQAMGFRFDLDGLSFELREGDPEATMVSVTRDMPALFRFLGFSCPGYDHARYTRGFRSQEALFNFVASSRYFDPSHYALHDSTRAPRDTGSCDAFAQWRERGRVEPGAGAGLDPRLHLGRAKLMFPDFARRLAHEARRRDIERVRRARFNGDLVGAWTGLAGPQLGRLMARCRVHFPGGVDAFDAFLDTTPLDTIRAYVTGSAHTMSVGRGTPPALA